MNYDLMFSSDRMSWETPPQFFEKLDSEFNFTLDPCADDHNHLCEKYFTEKDNGLIQSWKGERVFCNPPYGRGIAEWVKKCSEKEADICVMLIPARTDTRWFHDYILNRAEVRFVKGRLKFGDGKKDAPFPSMVVVFRKEKV